MGWVGGGRACECEWGESLILTHFCFFLSSWFINWSRAKTWAGTYSLRTFCTIYYKSALDICDTIFFFFLNISLINGTFKCFFPGLLGDHSALQIERRELGLPADRFMPPTHPHLLEAQGLSEARRGLRHRMHPGGNALCFLLKFLF